MIHLIGMTVVCVHLRSSVEISVFYFDYCKIGF